MVHNVSDQILKNPVYSQNVNFKFSSRTILYGDEASKHRYSRTNGDNTE